MDVRILVKRIIVGWIILLLLVAFFGRVTIAETNAGNTAAEFLLIGAGARPSAMGGAFSAVSEGAVASYWNPAGLTSVETSEFLLSHFAWYQDMTVEYGAYARQMSDRMTLAASVTYFNYGAIDGFDLSGLPTGEISAYDIAGAISLGYKTSEKLSLGLTGKVINQKLDDISATTFAVDFGTKYDLGRIALAGVLTNLGPDISFDGTTENLPAALHLGLAGYPVEDRLLLTADVEKRLHGETVVHQGVEFNHNGQYFLRSGYSYYPSADERNFATGITLGAGLKFNNAAFDYAYTFEEKYSSEDLHRFTIIFQIGP
ncbi:MAG: PorV/PorQ family protein [Candidatus Zixiibacteriota bacterium]